MFPTRVPRDQNTFTPTVSINSQESIHVRVIQDEKYNNRVGLSNNEQLHHLPTADLSLSHVISHSL